MSTVERAVAGSVAGEAAGRRTTRMAWLSRRPGFQIIQVWHLSVATVTLQALTSWLLLRREFKRKLPAAAGAMHAADAASPPAPGGAG